MRGLIFFIWLALYTIGMWTESSTAFLRELSVSFQLVSEPSLSGFWSVSYTGVLMDSRLLLLFKVFHVLSSFILGLLFFHWMGVRFLPVVFLLLVVTFIEVMQVFFTREALALDVLLNASGVISAAALLWVWQNVIQEMLEREPMAEAETMEEEADRLQEK
ncbi:hypothetical protein [Alkalicoccus daliensis]|uniref:VanZ like family protein n=1 Tax=Alkalicoccus daliensis TaxID=745820 RepID=A0A1H0J5E3_9BACI|nr:hypothetical protein [Alkalicoccus daliensis]SDO38956.1 hypothetical protein SAMN04488053_11279 [Alkalicoccus daliensis]